MWGRRAGLSALPYSRFLHPHDPYTAGEIEREEVVKGYKEVVKGYKYERGRFVTLTADELKSSRSSRRIGIATPVCRNRWAVLAEQAIDAGPGDASRRAIAAGPSCSSRRRRLAPDLSTQTRRE
jgi:hypothetical protein